MRANHGSRAPMALWDSSGEPPPSATVTYCWNGHAERGACRSLLRYVEDHGERLRREYLAWIHDLGETRLAGTRVVDRLGLDDGFSYWWMMLLTEHSPWKSPSIVDALRLLALEDILKHERPAELCLFTANVALAEAVRETCRGLGIPCRQVPVDANVSRFGLRRLYRRLPHPVKALIFVARYLAESWPLRAASRPNWFSGPQAVMVCSYFIHLDRAACSGGTFKSGHWGALTARLPQWCYRANWLQHYLESDVVPSTRVAAQWVAQFTQRSETEGVHALLDAFLDVGILLRVARGWCRLQLRSWRLRAIRPAFLPRDRHACLWPLLRDDWFASLRGAMAIRNLLWLELFDRALAGMPRQQSGLYLCENQGWERALIHAWRRYGHGELTAVAHSTMRFWDLRYFTDPRTLASREARAIPQPDRLAVNGPAAIREQRAFSSQAGPFVECEALRYDHLRDLGARPVAHGRDHDDVQLLVIGDFDAVATAGMLALLATAIPLSGRRVRSAIKPHPNFMVNPADHPSLGLTVIDQTLGQILPGAWDLAFASNTTSASVDAYFAGVPVAVMLDPATLNFSPLRGRSGIRFVSTAAELVDVLHGLALADSPAASVRDFFFLDPALPRWRRLLDSQEGSGACHD